MFRLEGKVRARHVLAQGRSVILFHWSFVVVRGRSWSFVVVRGRSWSFVLAALTSPLFFACIHQSCLMALRFLCRDPFPVTGVSCSHLEMLGQKPSPSASHDIIRLIHLVSFSGQVSGIGLMGSSSGSSMPLEGGSWRRRCHSINQCWSCLRLSSVRGLGRSGSMPWGTRLHRVDDMVLHPKGSSVIWALGCV